MLMADEIMLMILHTKIFSFTLPVSHCFSPSAGHISFHPPPVCIWQKKGSIFGTWVVVYTFMIFAPSIKHLWGGKLWCVKELSASLEEKH